MNSYLAAVQFIQLHIREAGYDVPKQQYQLWQNTGSMYNSLKNHYLSDLKQVSIGECVIQMAQPRSLIMLGLGFKLIMHLG